MLPCGCSNQTTGALPLTWLCRKGSCSICWAPCLTVKTPSDSPPACWEKHKNMGTGVRILIQHKEIGGWLSYHWLRLVRLLHCMDMHRCFLMKARPKHAQPLIYKCRHAEKALKLRKLPQLHYLIEVFFVWFSLQPVRVFWESFVNWPCKPVKLWISPHVPVVCMAKSAVEMTLGINKC